MQTKIQSLKEACASTLIGAKISVVLTAMFAYAASQLENSWWLFWVQFLVMTVISVVRQYCVRRYYNNKK